MTPVLAIIGRPAFAILALDPTVRIGMLEATHCLVLL